LEDAGCEREDDGGEEDDELGAEQDLLEVDDEAAERGAGDLADESDIGLLAERGGGEVVGGAAEVANGHILGRGVEEGGGGGVHAPPPLFFLLSSYSSTPTPSSRQQLWLATLSLI
jgi:hypothetical protein